MNQPNEPQTINSNAVTLRLSGIMKSIWTAMPAPACNLVLYSQSEKSYALSKNERKHYRNKKKGEKIRDLRNRLFRRLVELRNLHKKGKVSLQVVRNHEAKCMSMFPNMPLESHSGSGFSLTWKIVMSLVKDKITADHERMLTSMFLCLCSCYNSANLTGMCFSVMQFVNSHYPGDSTIARDIWSIMMSSAEVSDVPVNDYETLESHSTDSSKIFKDLQYFKNNWQLLKDSSLFPKVHKFLCALVTVGLMKDSSLEWSLGGVDIFSKKSEDITMNAVDCIDAITQLTLFLAENGIYAFTQKSLRPLLFDNKFMMDTEDVFFECQSAIPHVQFGNLTKFCGISEKEFEHKLTQLGKDINELLTTLKGPPRHIWLKRRELVYGWVTDVINNRLTSGTRAAPYCPVIVGDSSIGKTSLTQIFARELGVANGFKTHSRYQAVVQGNDPFWTAYRTDTEVVILDDFGNTKTEYCKEDEGMKQILINNNQICYAPKADVTEKGKVLVEPKLMIINTNDHTMKSDMSVNPYSRMRRGSVYIQAWVKEEYCRYVDGVRQNEIDDEKIEQKFGKKDADGNLIVENGVIKRELKIIPDLWEISFERPYQTTDGAVSSSSKVAAMGGSSLYGKDLGGRGKQRSKIAWQPVVINGKSCTKMSIMQALRILSAESRRYFAGQEAIVDVTTRMNDEYVACEYGCGCSAPLCEYDPCDGRNKAMQDKIDQLSSKEVLESHSWNLVKTVGMSWATTRFGKLNKKHVNNYVESSLLELYKNMETPQWYNLFLWMPDSIYNHRYTQDYLFRSFKPEIKKLTWWQMFTQTLLPAAGTLCFLQPLFGMTLGKASHIVTNLMLGTLLTAQCVHSWKDYREQAKELIAAKLARHKEAMPLLCKDLRAKYGKIVMGGLGLLASGVLIANVIKTMRNFSHESQSLLKPTNLEELDTRNSLPNEWVSEYKKNPVCAQAGCVTLTHLAERSERNLYTCVYTNGEDETTSCSLVLRNGVILVPKHAMKEVNATRIQLIRNKWNQTIPLSTKNVYEIPDTDLAIIYSGKIQGRDLTRHLRKIENNTSNFGFFSTLGMVIYSDVKGNVYKDETRVKYDSFVRTTRGGNFPGWYYNLRRDSFPGMCGAVVLVQDGRSFKVGGIHLGGTASRGGGGSLTLEQYDLALRHFQFLPDIPDEGLLHSHVDGKQVIYLGAEPREKSPLRFRDELNHHEHLGTCVGESKFRTSVHKSLISDTVTEIVGVPNNYGPPRVNPWYRPYHLDLDKRSNQPVGFGIDEILRARVDYVAGFCSMIRKLPVDVRNSFVEKPLTQSQIMFGVDNQKFVDRMNFSSAPGFPYTGTKRQMCIMNNEEPIDFEPWVWNKMKEAEDVLANGFRLNCVFKSSLKDEITKQFKSDGSENEKVRVFTCAPLILQLLIRKYFLPVASMLSYYPLDSEIAVGINASGPDFHELMEHINKMGENEYFVAGDFSKYDLGMSPDVILAAFACMTDIAKNCLRYSNRSLDIMAMIAGEVANPVIAYNGDLIRVTGSNPSGQNMTVYINSIVNSLYHRCVFRRLCKVKGKFRDHYTLTTYGDDSLGAPNETIRHMVNFNTIAQTFQSVGIKYTPADKSDSAPDFIPFKDVDFLKRKPLYNEDVGLYLGALAKDSLYKSLHCNATNTLPPGEASAVNLGNSIMEMFNHGKTEYEDWRSLVRQIAARHDLIDDIRLINVSYDEYVQQFKQKYNI